MASISSVVATSLVRLAAYSVPTLFSLASSTEQGLGFGLAAALYFGAIDGFFRLRVSRSARCLVPETDALVISSAFASTRIAWSSVLAIEVWQRLNRVDYVAVHYRATNGKSVATCWDQNSHKELLLFVRRCAELAQVAGPRRSVAFAHLGDRAVYAQLFVRFSVDLAVALLVCVLCEVPDRVLVLGVAAGLISTAMVAASYRYRKELVRGDDSVWRQRTKNGELTALRRIPRSLELWVGALSETAH